MAISFVGSSSAPIASGTGSANMSLPASLAEDDIVIAGVACDSSLGGGNGGISDGSDAGTWTSVYLYVGSPGSETYYKRMGATPDSTINVAQQAIRYQAFLSQAFRGVDTTTAIDNSVSSAAGSGLPDPPSHTTVTDNAWRVIMGFLDDDDDAANISAPSGGGYSNLTAEDTGQASTTAGATIMIASKLQASAGAEDPGTFGGSQADLWEAIHFALRPAGGGGGRITSMVGIGGGLVGPGGLAGRRGGLVG